MKQQTIVIPSDELKVIHCKTYIEHSFDLAIKLFQTREIRKTGETVTYSEAVRRVLKDGLKANGITVLDKREAA